LLDFLGRPEAFFTKIEPLSLKFLMIRKLVDLGAFLLAAISLPVKPFLCKAMMTAHVSLEVTMIDRGRTMIPSTTLLLKLEASSLLFNLNQHDRVISSLVLVNTHTCVNERITDMSAGPFVAGLKCSGNILGGIQFI
jgi:hypothetical protein